MSTRLVVCDDEVHITRTISMKLSKAGFDVETACDGQAALEAIQRELPALVITDCQMPRMGGGVNFVADCANNRKPPTCQSSC
jgi:CheY-like chemotaxis protein